MRRSFRILEDFVFVAIFLIAAALVTVAVYTGNDAYPLVGASAVVTSAQDRGVRHDLEVAPAPAKTFITPSSVAISTPSTSSGNAAAN